MKFTNIDLAIELAAHVGRISQARSIDPEALLTLAQYLADHPTTNSLHPTVLQLLDINDIPTETWGQPWPPRETGEARVSRAVQRLNDEYPVGTLHGIVALRRLAWDAQQLARELQQQREAVAKQLLGGNEGRSTGIFALGPTHLGPVAREQYRKLLGNRTGGNNG
jgi:hypothetical protein